MTKEPFIPEECWRAALAFAAPGTPPDAPTATEARSRIETGVITLFAMTRGHPVDWLKAAQGGRELVRGMRSLELFFAQMNAVGAHGHLDDEKRRVPENVFSSELEQQIEKACRALELMREFVERSEAEIGPKEKFGPNAKPALHFAVGIVLQEWQKLIGEKPRLKKEFIEFAFLCLEHAHASATRSSIQESFDRHVRLVEEARHRTPEANGRI